MYPPPVETNNSLKFMDVIDSTNPKTVTLPPLKIRGWQKILLLLVGIVIITIAVIIFIPSILNLFAEDIALINDVDLQLKKVVIADSENAYFDLIKLDKAIYEPKGKSGEIIDMVSGKIWDDKLVEEIISMNSKSFEYFSEAAIKPKFQDPVVADPLNISPNIILPNMNVWRKMARLSAIRAVYLANQGRDKEAMEEVLNSVKIGQKIQESQAPLIEYLVANAMKGVGLETTQRIVASSKLSSSELAGYAQELNAFYKNEDGLINSFKAEYHMSSWMMDALASGDQDVLKEIVGEEESKNQEIAEKVKNNYYFQPNKTKLLFAEYTRAHIKSVNQPCAEIKAIEVLRLVPTNPVKLYTEENAIGRILHDIGAASLTNVSTKKCQEDFLVAATQTMIAVKAFKKDMEEYPSVLNELVPRYLASVPIDPFDGKPLKYSAPKKIVYSVGQDTNDSGGSIGDDWRQMSDPTFKLGF